MASDAERVKEKIDIVDIVGEYVQLKKAGRNYKALSPFRTEKSPSLIVSQDRQIFKDFGGDKGGDVITFIMEIENITFQEALKHLADKAGIKLTQNAPNTKEEKQKDKIFSINHLTAQFYNYLLTKHKVGKNALEYATQKRELPEKLINSFSIGYAPDAHSLISYLTKKKGYTYQDLEEAGVVARYSGRLIDFFRNRLIFPIHDVRGNIIAFSGRALDDSAQPKYINTRETQVYKKSKSLYGIYQAKDSIRKEKKVIVVEGELDVLSPRKEGITNIVASKGTALTEDHIRLLKRFAEKIVFCFDRDPAGTEAQRRALEMIEKHGLTASVILIPSGKDPDELARQNPQDLKRAIKNEVNIYDYIIDSAVDEFGVNTADAKRKVMDRTLPMLAHIENEVVKEHYLKKLATSLDTTLPSLQKELDKRKRPTQTQKTTTQKKETLEEYLLTRVLQAKDPQKQAGVTKKFQDNIPLTNPGIEKLFTHLEQEGTANIPQELKNLFDEAYLRPTEEFSTEVELQKELQKTQLLVKKAAAKEQLKKIAQQLKDEKDDKRQESLGKEYTRLAEVLK